MHNIYIRPENSPRSETSLKRNGADAYRLTDGKHSGKDLAIKSLQNTEETSQMHRFAVVSDGLTIGEASLIVDSAKNAEYHLSIEPQPYGMNTEELVTYQVLHYAKEVLVVNSVYFSADANQQDIEPFIKCGFRETGRDHSTVRLQCLSSDVLPPEVSVFVLVYNHEKFLRRCLDGILMQKCGFTYTVVVGEDCSTDRSREILVEYAKKFPGKFRLLLHPKNIGAVRNQNAVFEACSGQYIAICEGDDYWTDSSKLQKQMDIMIANPEIGLVYTDIDRYNTVTGKWERAIFKNGTAHRSLHFEDHLENRGYLAPLTWLFKKGTLSMHLSETTDIVDSTFEVMLDAFKTTGVHYLDEVTGVKNEVRGSASNPADFRRIFAYQKGLFAIQKKYAAKYKVDGPLHDRILSSGYLRMLSGAVRLGDDAFISEAQEFFTARNLDFEQLLVVCRRAALLEALSAHPLYRLVKDRVGGLGRLIKARKVNLIPSKKENKL